MRNTDGLMPPWQPGQSGNPGGRPKSKPFREALLRAIDLAGGLDEWATSLLAKAKEGDVSALKELADRVDGKVPQGVVGGDETDNPVSVIHRIERVIVNAANPDG